MNGPEQTRWPLGPGAFVAAVAAALVVAAAVVVAFALRGVDVSRAFAYALCAALLVARLIAGRGR